MPGSNKDVLRVVKVAAALVNTSPVVAGSELLGDLGQVRDFEAMALVTEVPSPTMKDLASLHKLRSQLWEVFAAEDGEPRVRLLNSLLVRCRIEPRLTDHDGLGLHIHYFPLQASLSEHLIADCTMAISLMLQMGEGGRLRICAAVDCEHAFVDESRNRSRLYCDGQSCGNRVHAAAYRRRKRPQH